VYNNTIIGCNCPPGTQQPFCELIPPPSSSSSTGGGGGGSSTGHSSTGHVHPSPAAGPPAPTSAIHAGLIVGALLMWLYTDILPQRAELHVL
jgi:hypothetical protein